MSTDPARIVFLNGKPARLQEPDKRKRYPMYRVIAEDGKSALFCQDTVNRVLQFGGKFTTNDYRGTFNLCRILL